MRKRERSCAHSCVVWRGFGSHCAIMSRVVCSAIASIVLNAKVYLVILILLIMNCEFQYIFGVRVEVNDPSKGVYIVEKGHFLFSFVSPSFIPGTLCVQFPRRKSCTAQYSHAESSPDSPDSPSSVPSFKAYARSPRMRRASCMSFTMTVVRLP